MKRLIAAGLCALAFWAGTAHAASVGVGAFGGVTIPVGQDDNGQGTIFGARVPVALNHLLTIEPYFGSTQGGDNTQNLGGLDFTRSGFDVTSFGATVMLTFGSRLQFYPFGTFDSNQLSRPGSDDRTMTGLGGGLGLGFAPSPRFRVHVRGEASKLTGDGIGRMFGTVTAGVSYTLRDFSSK